MTAQQLVAELSRDQLERLLYTAVVRISRADGDDAELKVLYELMARDQRVQSEMQRKYGAGVAT